MSAAMPRAASSGVGMPDGVAREEVERLALFRRQLTSSLT